MNTPAEIGDVAAILAETPEKFQRILPKENTVRVRNLIKRYEMGTQTVDALRGVNFQIQRGEYISIMGPLRFRKVNAFQHDWRLRQTDRGQSLHRRGGHRTIGCL